MYLFLLDQSSVVSEQSSEAIDAFDKNLSLFQKWIEQFNKWFPSFWPKLIVAILMFIIGWWLTKLICKIMVKALNKTKADPTVVSFLKSVISAALKIMVIILVLATLGFDVTTIIAALGAAAITIGLALKDSLANVASGTRIILNKKFKIGDYLETEGLKGNVIGINMMYTTLCTYDNKIIQIPNSRLTNNNIVNYFVQDERRIDLIVPISYSSDIQKAREIIMKLMESNDMVIKRKDRRNRVAVDTLNESSVDLSVWIWCKSEDYWILMEDMKEGIKNSLDANNIHIPFNQLDIHLVEDKTKEKKER